MEICDNCGIEAINGSDGYIENMELCIGCNRLLCPECWGNPTEMLCKDCLEDDERTIEEAEVI